MAHIAYKRRISKNKEKSSIDMCAPIRRVHVNMYDIYYTYNESFPIKSV